MPDPPVTPAIVFPLPGFTGAIQPHGAPENVGGSDIFAPYGSTVLNMINGTVDFVGTQGTPSGQYGGNSVEVHGADGNYYYYAHMLNPTGLKVGQSVSVGQQLGQVDNTGNAANTQAHLHIGIGKSITTGAGPAAGIGTGFNAVAMLRNLQANPNTNNALTMGQEQATLPPINFVPSVPGFTEAHLSDIQTNLDAALKAGVDPFVWLAIVAHESNFQDGVINPKSGACGYAQLYPCVNVPTTGAANAETGLQKLIAFLQQCHGDLTCALDNHYSGGMPGYAALIKQWADAIEQANPQLAQAIKDGTYKGTQGTGSVDVSGAPSGSSSDTTAAKCPPIPIPIGPTTAYFPDVGCMLTQSVTALKTGLTEWFAKWQTEHVPTWIFAIAGIILVIIGLSVIAGDSSNPVGQAAQGATKIVGPELLAA